MSQVRKGNIREVFEMLPRLTHQIDDMAEAGDMYAVGHQSLQDLPVCFYTVGSIVCNYCPDVIHIEFVAVGGGYYGL